MSDKIANAGDALQVRVPDTRGVTLSPWSTGNLKLGPGIVSYSKLPGRPSPHGGTCPGATPECLTWCYAFRIGGIAHLVHEANTRYWNENMGLYPGGKLPPLPEGTEVIRFHVAGDFDSADYIRDWCDFAAYWSGVRFFGYTRSWRIPGLLPRLNAFRMLPNVQLFASIDKSNTEEEVWLVAEWRKAWLRGDPRLSPWWGPVTRTAYDCPEETGRKENCASCRYCIDGKKGDVAFKLH